MSELRYNPFLQDWVIIDSNRQQRPNLPADWCPFCPGSGKVPEDYDVYVYDNDFPILRQEWQEASGYENDFFQAEKTYGKCEVILYHPNHIITLSELTVSHIKKLVDLWCGRYEELSKDEKIKYIYIFENRGKEAGVTMPHPHGQLYAFGWIPKIIQTELAASREHFIKTGRCLMCHNLEAERKDGARVVYENESFCIFVPYFTAWPYGTYIVSKEHTGNLLGLNVRQKIDLADALKKITGAYDSLFDKLFPYMMAIHQTPVNSCDASDYYHLHIEFYPPLRSRDKEYFRASSETGAGAYCNVTLPEEKAIDLKEALVRFAKKVNRYRNF
jgi:UDPglucose--hexose-1-phosphate uridylyltransferase